MRKEVRHEVTTKMSHHTDNNFCNLEMQDEVGRRPKESIAFYKHFLNDYYSTSCYFSREIITQTSSKQQAKDSVESEKASLKDHQQMCSAGPERLAKTARF
ncbi:hypothetical protein QYF36_026060 [Acer negundo]|nr:hypothetical protein QYF36_026060 [Acer negundo]